MFSTLNVLATVFYLYFNVLASYRCFLSSCVSLLLLSSTILMHPLVMFSCNFVQRFVWKPWQREKEDHLFVRSPKIQVILHYHSKL